MYPIVDSYKRSLVALMLQQADPIDLSQFEEPTNSKPEITIDADALIQSVMQKMNFNVPRDIGSITTQN